MIEATSCGGVVIYRGKILTLYKSYKNKYQGWVLPKGTVEKGEEYKDTAVREVMEEAGVQASIINVYRKESVHVQRAGGHGGEGCALVSDDGRQLLQQAAERRILCGFRLL